MWAFALLISAGLASTPRLGLVVLLPDRLFPAFSSGLVLSPIPAIIGNPYPATTPLDDVGVEFARDPGADPPVC